MTNPTLISFVRHGHVYNPQGVFYGRLPGFPLSEEGRRQAHAAAEALRDGPLAAVFSSPLLRARETAEAILKLHTGLDVHVSELLTEVKTPFDGQPISEVAGRNWDVFTASGPEYEQPLDVFTRARQFVAETRQQYPGQHAVAATHGDLIAVLMLWVRGMAIQFEHKQALYRDFLAPGSITTFSYVTMSEDELPTLDYQVPYSRLNHSQ